jgi:hypothetical protein
MGQRGYTVDYQAVSGAATTLDQAAGDLATVSGGLARPPAFTEDVFGEYGAQDAAKAFVGAWQDELRVDHDAVAQSAANIRQCLANYQQNDGAVAAGLGGA